MAIKINGLALFDLSSVKFLKKKEFKSFPGGIFSILFKLVNLSLFLAIICLMFFEPTKMKSQLSYKSSLADQETSSIQGKINITISSKKVLTEDTYAYIDSRFKLIEYFKNGTKEKIYGRLYKGNIIQTSNSYALNYSIPSSDLVSQQKDAEFPRLGIESCAILKSSSLPFFLVLENTDLLNDCVIDDNPLQFYENEIIANSVFLFNYFTDYHVLEPDYTMKAAIKTYTLFFSFQYDQPDTYITELNRIALMNKGSAVAKEYINWLTPDYQVLGKFVVNDHYSLHILFTTDYDDVVVMFILYKNGFLYYLGLLGTLAKVVDILLFIPAIWTPYYASLVIIKYYLKRKKEKEEETDVMGEDYDWENLKYCRWLFIRFGCSLRDKRLNEQLIRMRGDAIEQYEKLYSTPDKEGKQTELQVKEEN